MWLEYLRVSADVGMVAVVSSFDDVKPSDLSALDGLSMSVDSLDSSVTEASSRLRL